VPGTPAHAHTPFEGFEGVFSGLFHPLFEPVQGMLLLAGGLLIGRQGRQAFARGWAVWGVGLSAGVVLGLLSARASAGALAPDRALIAVAIMVLGAGVALSDRLGAGSLAGLAGLGGVVAGLNAVPDPGPLAAMAVTALGAGVAGVLLAGYAGAGAVWLSQRSGRLGEVAAIGMRVAASWLAAAGALVSAFALRGG
jgi:hypothetical protein